MEEKDNKIVLLDEEGGEHQFEVVDVLPVNEINYAILLPDNGDKSNGEVSEGDEEAFIFRVVEKEGEHALEEIEDEEEWNLVAEAWEKRIIELEEEDSHTTE